MNKKAETGFYLGLAVLSLILIVLGLRVTLENDRTIHNTPGIALEELLSKELMFTSVENYLDYSFRFSFFSALNSTLSRNTVWDEDPTESFKMELLKKTREEFVYRLQLLQDQQFFPHVTYPRDFTLELKQDKRNITVLFASRDELVLNDNENSYPIVVLHDTLQFEHTIDFDLGFLSSLYQRYSLLETDEQCKNVQKNELFDQYSVTCVPEGDYLRFDVETKDLGLIKPVITFRIAKPGGIEFTQK